MLIRMDKMNINGIANGDNTQNHDHSIYPVSFNPMNNIVSNPKNPVLNIVVSVISIHSFALRIIFDAPYLDAL